MSETVGLSLGAGILTAPDAGLNLAMTGRLTNVLISSNVGLPIAEDDRTNGPINDVRYNGNQIYSTTFGSTVFFEPPQRARARWPSSTG